MCLKISTFWHILQPCVCVWMSLAFCMCVCVFLFMYPRIQPMKYMFIWHENHSIHITHMGMCTQASYPTRVSKRSFHFGIWWMCFVIMFIVGFLLQYPFRNNDCLLHTEIYIRRCVWNSYTWVLTARIVVSCCDWASSHTNLFENFFTAGNDIFVSS